MLSGNFVDDKSHWLLTIYGKVSEIPSPPRRIDSMRGSLGGYVDTFLCVCSNKRLVVLKYNNINLVPNAEAHHQSNL